MKVFSLVTILFILTSTLCKGQRHLSFELGGSGGLASINLENTIHQKGNLRVAFRSGFSYIPIDKNNGGALIFPNMIHGSYGKEVHFADFGFGLAPSITSKLAGAYIRVPLSFGYRIQPKEKKYYLRFSYTPLVSFLFDFQWQHWAGITYAIKLKPKTSK